MSSVKKGVILLSLFVAMVVSAAMPIVIPDKANEVERMAAVELREYLSRSTGEKYVVVAERKVKRGTAGYYLGKTKRAADVKIVSPAAANCFVIKYLDGSLFIVGRDGDGKEKAHANPAGTLFGVYYFLDKQLGVKWIFPGPDGDYVPGRKGFVPSAKCDVTFTARFAQRNHGAAHRMDKASYRFIRRTMFLANIRAGAGGHNTFIYRQYGKTNPEFFAMTAKGKRLNVRNGSFCLTNPGFQDVLLKVALKRNFHINCHEADSVARCECENCNKLDGEDLRAPTGRYDRFRNRGERYARWYRMMLDKGKKLDPRMTVSAYAYQSFIYAPRKTKLHKDIHVSLVPDLPFPRRKSYTKFLRNEYDLWFKSGASMYLRPNNFNGGYCMPEVWYDEFADEVNYLYKRGALGVSYDSGSGTMFATRGLDNYVANRIILYPGTDPEVFFEEFISAFGKAAPEMRKYFKFWQKYMHDNRERINDIYETANSRRWYFHGYDYAQYAHRIFPAKVLKSQIAVLERAAKLAKGDVSAEKKVAFFRSGLDHAILTSECARIFASHADPAKKNAEQKRLIAFRKKMPPYAINESKLNNIESRSWKSAEAPLLSGIIQPLPEFFKGVADPENKGEKLGYFKEKFNDSKWKSVSTWRSFEANGFQNHLHAFYRCKFNVPEQDDRRCILRLGAVDKDCKVWINGNFVGEHKFDPETNPYMWNEPVEFDITDQVKYNKSNVLCVKVSSRGEDHSGIFKPSFVRFELPAKSKPVYLKFAVPAFAKKIKIGKMDAVYIQGIGPEDPKFGWRSVGARARGLIPGKRYRIRGEFFLRGDTKSQIMVLFRQNNGKRWVRSRSISLKYNSYGWRDFSLEDIASKDAVWSAVYFVVRSVPKKGYAQFRNIRIEEI